MNRTEFIEMQNEFADYLYEYEKVIKEGYLLDLKYNKEFSSLLVELHNLEIETGVMKDCLEKLQAGEAIENLNAFILKVKESFKKKLVEIESKNKRAVEVTARTEALTDEEKKDFEEYFHEFVKEYYPQIIDIVEEKIEEPVKETKVYERGIPYPGIVPPKVYKKTDKNM